MNTTGGRQQAGFACEECRRRKARCDRVRPRCGLCAEIGVPCIFVDQRPQRGPKKGQLDEMRTRIVLEWQLGKQLENRQDDLVSKPDAAATTAAGDARFGVTIPNLVPPEDQNTTRTAHHLNEPARQTITPEPSIGGEPPSSTVILPISTSNDTAAATSAMVVAAATTEATNLPVWMEWQDMDLDGGVMLADVGDMLQFELEPVSPVRVLGGFEITNLVLADLNQLFFDRAHDVLPMIHRRHYFGWADQEKPTPSRACLRSAMHTVAAAMSAQYRGLDEALYHETRVLLESQRARTHSKSSSSGASWLASSSLCPRSSAGDKIPLELIQAWLLLAHYEFLRIDEHQAMLTAGRAFRLVQLARLYEVDGGVEDMSPSPAEAETGGDQSGESPAWIEAEERRRTFWLAFSFDRFLCSRNEWPLTLQEEAVRTRLPAPEVSFQNSQPTRVCFLSEALAMTASQSDTSTAGPLSSFAECVVLAALHGRCMTHRRVSLASADTAEVQDFWARYDWLASALDKRVQLLAQSPSLKMVNRDPMVLFTHMLAHKTIIYLGTTLDTTPWQQKQQQQQQQTGGRQLMAASYKWQAERAAGELVRLAKSARSFGCFGMHPFIADPLACAADFLIRNTQPKDFRSLTQLGSSGSRNGGVESLLCVLRNLRDVNILARDYLCTLETDHSSWCAGRQR